jgi:hypothetical protein
MPSARISQWILLAAAGAASFYGANWLAGSDDEIDPPAALLRDVAAQPATRAAEGPVSAPPGAPAALPPARPAIDAQTPSEPFGGRSWAPPPPPPPPVVQAAPVPAAPVAPFRFAGMLEQGTQAPAAFLAQGEVLHVVKTGDVIEGTYRVESLSRSQVVITNLSTNQKLTLGVAGEQP